MTREAAAANASPVPLCGVGKTSGAYPYSTPYIAFSKKEAIEVSALIEGPFRAAVNPKRKIPAAIVENLKTNFEKAATMWLD